MQHTPNVFVNSVFDDDSLQGRLADYLLKTTAAVRLLGAKTILTGISPQVARTIVELGVSLSALHTRNTLADGLSLALSMLDKQITEGRGP